MKRYSKSNSSNSFIKNNINLNDALAFPSLSKQEETETKTTLENTNSCYMNLFQEKKIDMRLSNPNRKSGWVTLTNESRTFFGKDEPTPQKREVSAVKGMQKLVDRWKREKEEYIAAYGLEDYVNTYGSYDYITDDECEYEDFDYMRDEIEDQMY
jgi:hypothetical protein